MVLVSDSNTDDLLSQLKQEFEPDRRAGNNSHRHGNSTPPPNSSQTAILPLLEQLGKDIESGKIRPEREKKAAASPSTPSPKKQVRDASKNRDRLLAEVKQDYQAQARKREAKFAEARRKEAELLAAQQRQQQELIAAQKQEQLRERRRKEALKETAKEWLKNLNLRSEEGKWFEEFSYSYEDKLQAAIDYLEAMRESGLR